MSAEMVESWADDDGLADVVEADDWSAVPVVGASWGRSIEAGREYSERRAAYLGHAGPEAQRAEFDRRNADAAVRESEPWRGVDSLTEAQWEAFRVRELPGASPRLRAYVQGLTDGPKVVWAWWLAHCLVTGEPQRFMFDDRSHREDWLAGCRKSPAQIEARVRRLYRDATPVTA